MQKRKIMSYRNLSVWQKAIRLALKTYNITDSFPKKEIYGITS
jgi:hypothetical protein